MVACLVFDNKIISVCKTTYKCVALIGQRLFPLAGTIYHGSVYVFGWNDQTLGSHSEWHSPVVSSWGTNTTTKESQADKLL